MSWQNDMKIQGKYYVFPNFHKILLKIAIVGGKYAHSCVCLCLLYMTVCMCVPMSICLSKNGIICNIKCTFMCVPMSVCKQNVYICNSLGYISSLEWEVTFKEQWAHFDSRPTPSPQPNPPKIQQQTNKAGLQLNALNLKACHCIIHWDPWRNHPLVKIWW